MPAARSPPTRIRGNIWDNFSSSTYKDLPSVGTITVQDPFTGKRWQFLDAGRRTRLHPRALAGQRLVDGAVPAQQPARTLLFRSVGRGAHEGVRRVHPAIVVAGDARHEDGLRRFHRSRTTESSSIEIPKRSIPVQLKNLVGDLPEPFQDCSTGTATFKLGPIPKGFPINIAASYQPMVDVDARRDWCPCA